MKKYDNYKDSGIEWIGQIPEDWEIIKFNLCVKIRHGHQFMNYDFTEDGVKIVKITQLHKNGYLDLSNCSFVTAERVKEFNNILIKENDILMCLTGGTIGKIIRVGSVNEPLLQNYRVGHFSSAIDNKICDDFIFWVMSSEYLVSQIFFQMRETGQPNIGMDDFGRMKITIPSIKEQQSIANYLDHKTTQIDALITKKKQFISLLQEERTAVINQAVTKGLDPKVKMKDSGIEWLGEIPEYWDVKKLKYVGNCQNGISEGAEFFGTGHPFVSYSDVYKNEVLPKNVLGLANSNEKHQENYSVEESDIFFTRTSETVEEIGIASICNHTIEKAVFAGFLIRFRPNKELIIKEFSRYYFRCFIPRTFFVKEMNLVTRASLSQELLKRLPILLPSINEQRRISTFLDKKTGEIDIVILKSKQEIELLKEYKTSLISEVVTGKVDVRKEVLN